MNYAGHHVISATTPTTTASPLAVGFLWSDTSNNSVKVCTSISPVTFSAISGGGVVSQVEFAGSTVPATPAAGHAILYATTTNGHTQLSLIDEDGTIVRVNRDAVLIVKNTTGGPLTKGQLVDINGSTGNIPTVRLADADITSTPPAHAEGALAEDIASNGFGLMILSGQVSGIDTSAWAEGTQLYTSQTAGAFTSTAPSPPAFIQDVGVVTRQHATQGSIELLVNAANIPVVGSGFDIIQIEALLG